MDSGRRFRDVTDQDPFGFYEELRGSAPVVWDSSVAGWLALDHESCATVLRREDLFPRADKYLPGGRDVRGSARSLAVLEGDEHQRLHHHFMKLLDRGIVDSHRSTLIRPLADRLLDALEGRDQVEFASDYADQLPLLIGLKLLGIGADDESLVRRVTALRRIQDEWKESMGADPAKTQAAAQAVRELKDIFMPFVRERKERPREDLISLLWRTGPSVFPDWDESDTYSGCLAYFGGGETSLMLRNIIFLLLHRSDVQSAVRARPSDVIPRLIEECLRVLGVVHWQLRLAAVDVVLGSAKIRRGDRVYAVIGAANRDPARYQRAGDLMLTEEDVKGHLAFGLGPRFCIGAALARAVGVEAVTALIERFKGLTPRWDCERPSLLGFHVRSYRPLFAHVNWGP